VWSSTAASALFGNEKDGSFKYALGAVYQSFGGKDLYSSAQEKAANLLYLVTKNHGFSDGNKRIAAGLFLYFLKRNRLLLRKDGSKRIADHTLVALTVMIAESKPAEKEMMVNLVMTFLS
jgi:Prophage maintenance system killer protein